MSTRKSIHNLCLLILSLLFLYALAGCSSAPPPSTPSQPKNAAPVNGPITLTLWHTRTGAEQNALAALARDFQKEFQDITVTPVYVGNEDELKKKLVAAIALNQPPDLILAAHRDIPAFVQQNGLIPLDDLSADPKLGLSAEDKNDLFPGILNEGVFGEFGGQRYSFPFDLDGMVLFYNVDLLKAGSFNSPPTTWAEFSDMASKATKDDQSGWAMNIQADVFSGMLVSQGSAPIDMPERRALFGERAGLASMNLAASLYKSGAAQLEPTRANSILDFAQGHAAFYIDWISALPELTAAQKKGQSFKLGIINLPQGDPRDPYVLVTGSDLALLRTTPERERQAWFLLRWLTGAKQTAQWAAASYGIPLRVSALALINLDSNSLLSPIEKSFNTTPPHFVPLSAHPRIDRVESLMEQAWQDSLEPKADIGTVLTNASTNANEFLAGNP